MMISVVMPAYKEAENLKRILPLLHKELSALHTDYEILVIDTMEPMDESQKICRKMNAECVKRQNGNLYGDAIRTGFSVAQGKYIIVMDADGSHNPNDIAAFYKEIRMGNYDLVIGSRYCKGGYTDNIFILRMMSRILNFTYRMIFNIKVKDISDSYRMYRADKLKSVRLECDNFDIVEEILIKLNIAYPQMKIKEIPIFFHKRKFGESKRDLIKFIMSYLKTIRHLLKIKRRSVKGID